jgi:hypothetical protein
LAQLFNGLRDNGVEFEPADLLIGPQPSVGIRRNSHLVSHARTISAAWVLLSTEKNKRNEEMELKYPEPLTMLTFVDNRKQLKIFVTPAAKKIVEDISEDFDMKEFGVASRIYEWFGRQPKAVQKWVLGFTDGTEADGLTEFAKQAMKIAARAKGKSPD